MNAPTNTVLTILRNNFAADLYLSNRGDVYIKAGLSWNEAVKELAEELSYATDADISNLVISPDGDQISGGGISLIIFRALLETVLPKVNWSEIAKVYITAACNRAAEKMYSIKK